MSDTEKDVPRIIQAGEELFRFAIDRADMHAILAYPPIDDPEKRASLESEIQILRIISVGWAITFFMEELTLKTRLEKHFWEQIRNFSKTLSSSASLVVGSDIDYFDIIKQRLNYYVQAIETDDPARQPAMVIGPAFSAICGNPEDARAILAGSKMFVHTMDAVREYLPLMTAHLKGEPPCA